MSSRRPVRIPDAVIARHPDATSPPKPHTAAELAHVVQLLIETQTRTIVIGHGRHRASCRAAREMRSAWEVGVGTVLDVVSWPADAASWLRPARRLVDAAADALVVADNPAGFAQLSRRLAGETGWSAAHTVGFAGLGHADLIPLADTDLAGMSGATADGGTWRFGHRLLVLDPVRIDR